MLVVPTVNDIPPQNKAHTNGGGDEIRVQERFGHMHAWYLCTFIHIFGHKVS